MANIKNFGIQGVGADVQFGKGGNRVVSEAGIFKVIDTANAAVKIKAALATAADDVVVLSQLTDSANAVTAAWTANAASQQALLAGLESNAATQHAEIAALDGRLTTAEGDITALEANAAAQYTELQGLVANAASQYTSIENLWANAAAQQVAIDALEANVAGDTAALQAEVDAIETAVGLNTDGTLVAFSGVYTTGATSVVGAIAALDAQANTAAGAATALEGRVTTAEGDIDALETRATDLESNAAAQAALLAGLEANAAAQAADLVSLDGRLDTAEADITALEALQDDYLTLDGSRPMAGALEMANHKIANVAAGTLATDAVNKSQLDDAIAVLGNAFNYVGVVLGGADAGNATTVSGNVAGQSDAGDYFKVTQAGYFTAVDGGAAIFANVNDGIVYNTDGGIDIIDNTNSTVSGTTDEITVTGSTDTGFVAALATTFKNRVSTLETDVAAAQADIIALEGNAVAQQAAIDALEAADVEIDGRLDALEANVAGDTAALQAEVDAIEAAVGLNTDGTLVAFSGTYTTGATTVKAAIDALDAEAVAADGRLDTLEANAATQHSEIVALQGNAASQAALLAGLEANAASQAADLVSLDGRVDTLEANAATQHAEIAALQANAVAQQAEIDAIEANIAGLDTTRIYDAAGTTYVDTDSVAGIVEVFATGEKVAQFESAGTADSHFSFDTGTAGEVRVEAVSGSATDVDIRLVPQGSGQVIVGETGTNGVIQADDGFDLVIAGGDNASGVAGDLILRAGAGTTDGTLFLGDAADAALSVVGSTIAAVGAADDINVVLDPKGTGSIDASSAKIVNVANGTSAQDAVTYSQLQAVAGNVTSSQVGSVRTVVQTVTAGTTNIGAEIKGTVTRVKVVVIGALTSLTVGDATVADRLVGSADIDEATIGTYLVETAHQYGALTQVQAVVAGAGSARILVEYIVE